MQRQNYNDISDAYDRMGNFGFGGGGGPASLVGPNLLLNTQVLTSLGLNEMQINAILSSCGTSMCCPQPAESTVGRLALVGLPAQCIPACACGEVVETTVCGPFTLTNLYIPPKIACCLALTRFRIGCWDLLVNCDPIPAELFACCELDENQFGARPVEANSPICLTFDNKCKADIEFEGALKGVICDVC